MESAFPVILITLLLLYKIAIINFLEELAYVRRRNKKKKNKKNGSDVGYVHYYTCVFDERSKE